MHRCTADDVISMTCGHSNTDESGVFMARTFLIFCRSAKLAKSAQGLVQKQAAQANDNATEDRGDYLHTRILLG